MRQITESQWLSANFYRCLQCGLEAWRHLADDQTRHDMAASRQASIVLLGALLIGAVWISLSFFLANERDSAERAAIQNSTNLADALASHLPNSLGEVDRSLTVIAALYAQRTENFDLLGFAQSQSIFIGCNIARERSGSQWNCIAE